MDGCHSKVNSARMLENISKIKRFDVKFTLVEISVWCKYWLDTAVFATDLLGFGVDQGQSGS